MAQEKVSEPFYAQRGQADANTTVHGVNPAFLIEKITRERILDSLYFKDQCFGLTASTVLDRVVGLTYIGGIYSIGRPTEFICLVFKMLQLAPEKDIILHYLHDDEFKYLRALAALYVRLVFSPKDVYLTLEPLLTDYRKLKVRGQNGFRLDYMDNFIDQLLTEPRVFDIALPNLMSRPLLEDLDELEPRESVLQAELESDGE
ncbi:Pre-mRNA-splicing factor 38A [Taphrina deformans PYCC 5710]|uniref:Pre-mRNA-splicing factor 38 n=1 Tax=Taphrina deformans (strain PYCC 5710 / ATCC 11124 / CBS 356.35 / IMI 108563 / JCM 9778 / NBRC 8474) TaxID=1097556 RepID=R4X9K4_TAPDE|nr:Pre-mRNA-splicing factor 38A [Taphrina deformans PYCC 5710]|eukprot:CCG82441.1 Pre-mRNA-splicing factor 38A [Taphrina deformans PYCC 5710]